MNLTLGVTLLSAGFLLFNIALLGSRNPKPPVWASEAMMSYFICPMIVGLVPLGIAGVIQPFFMDAAPVSRDYVISGAIIAGTIFIYLLLGVPRKLRAFEALEKAGSIIEGNFGQSPAETETKLPKAA